MPCGKKKKKYFADYEVKKIGQTLLAFASLRSAIMHKDIMRCASNPSRHTLRKI